MRDQYNREIDYMRISVTDLCNLRCRYCMPNGVPKLSMDEILTYEEILEIVRAASSCGIRKLKVTGGEPLVRRGILSLIREMKETPGIEQVTMTTNGVLLADRMEELKQAGLDAVNISLDTLDPDRFHAITGFDALPQVIKGIAAAVDAGIPTKVNSVLQTGMNDDEWPRLVRIAGQCPIDVRFIEMMPIGEGRRIRGVSNEALIRQIRNQYPSMRPDPVRHGNGPAAYYRIDGFRGSIGFISAIHGKFCDSCNRIRLTSTGKIKPCLCYGDTVDLRAILRDGQKEGREARLASAIAQAIHDKPEAHCFETPDAITEGNRMVEIGG